MLTVCFSVYISISFTLRFTNTRNHESVSVDDGHTWYTLSESSFLSPPQRGAWRVFKQEIPVPDADGWRVLAVRAWDGDGNTQDSGSDAPLHDWNWGLHTPGFAQRTRVYLVKKAPKQVEVELR